MVTFIMKNLHLLKLICVDKKWQFSILKKTSVVFKVNVQKLKMWKAWVLFPRIGDFLKLIWIDDNIFWNFNCFDMKYLKVKVKLVNEKIEWNLEVLLHMLKEKKSGDLVCEYNCCKMIP